MSTINDLATSVASAAGLPTAHVAEILKKLRIAGLISSKGRGTSAAAMTAHDLAMLVIALLASDRILNCAASTMAAAASPHQIAKLSDHSLSELETASYTLKPGRAFDAATFGLGVEKLIIGMTRPGLFHPHIMFDPDTLHGTIRVSISGYGTYEAKFGAKTDWRYKGLSTLRSVGTQVLEAGIGSLARPVATTRLRSRTK